MTKKTVYEIITDKFIESLEKGRIPWEKPWVGQKPMNYKSKTEYHGINVMILSMQGYSSRYWMTFKQVTSLGGKVKKGSKGTPVCYWNFFKKEDQDGNEKTIPFLKYFTVFNKDQIEGIEFIEEEEGTLDFSPIETCESIVNHYQDKPEIKHGNVDIACYSSSSDTITLTNKENFKSEEEYYSTLFHEMVHSTGHKSRLNRNLVNGFGSDLYSKEELIAEIGNAFLCSEAGILKNTIDNSTAYIQSWISKLKNDPKLIVSASGKATKAVDYILGK